MLSDSLRAIASVLETADSYAAIFGPAAGTGVDARKRALDASYRRLAKLAHPDVVADAHRADATRVFAGLSAAYDDATRALEQGTYDMLRMRGDTFVLASPVGTYTLYQMPLADGDYSVVYAGADAQGVRVIAKVARSPKDNPVLEHEAVLTGTLTGSRSGSARFFPRCLDQFLVADGALMLRVSVYAHDPALVSLAALLSAYPRGLAPEDAGWIARRVMAQALAAETVGLVHGAILPEHVLVHPLSREPLHLGWTHAQRATPAARIGQIIDARRAYYPPEVFAKKPVDARTDIYMAGAVITALFGGDVAARSLPRSLPKPVRESILSCTHESPARRPAGARAALDSLTRAIRDAWGKTYRPLRLPVRS